jgi:integrase
MPILSDALVRALPIPGRGNKITWDSGDPKKCVTGFGTQVTARGHRAFVLRYYIAGRERRMALGDYPVWSVAAAREEAKRLRREIDRGGYDPLAERIADREAPTVADLIHRYLTEHAVRKRERSRIEDERLIRQWIAPALGARKVADLRRADLERLHRKITEHGTPTRANRCLTLLSTMFSCAMHWEMRADNPASRIAHNHEEPRHRYLSADELRRLTEALGALPNQQAANAIRLLLLSGARRGEVLNATWSQFDFEAGVWTKPASSTKQRKMHRVPLSAPAQQLLVTIKETAGRSPYLFPERGADKPIPDIKRAWAQVRKAAQIPDVRAHDLRHSFASILVSQGLSLPIIGALLGHSRAQTTQRYAHLHDDPLRAATERAARVIAGNDDKPGTAEVIALNRR